MNDFAVFILSHKRAGNVVTLQTLKKARYTGKVFIVVDNEDTMLSEYKRIYDKQVIVFCKEEWKNKTDTMTNEKDFSSPVFARNFISWYATEKGYKHYLMLDDDIKTFNIRYPKEGKLKSKPLKNANVYFDYLIKLLDTNKNIMCVGTGNGGSYIGGISGKYSKGLHIGDFSQVALFKDRYEFKGAFNEDANISLIEGQKGNVTIVDLNISHSSPKRKSNSGGLKEDYDSSNDYYINMFSVICSPSCCSISVGKKGVSLKMKRNFYNPKILSERYKK